MQPILDGRADVIARIPREVPLLRGRLVSRYKRFLADVELDGGEMVVAHCVNTGAMEGLTRPGTPVWLSRAQNPKRKLAFTWELAEVDARRWGVNTGFPNRLIGKLLAERRLPWLAHWPFARPEKKYGERSRVDFWLSDGSHEEAAGREHFLEVKNCHLLYPDGYAYFPDCKSLRAAVHLQELTACLDCTAEVSAEVLFVVQVSGAAGVRPSDLHDPDFAIAARRAADHGVRFSAVGVEHTDDEIIVYGPLRVDMEVYSTEAHSAWREANRNRTA